MSSFASWKDVIETRLGEGVASIVDFANGEGRTLPLQTKWMKDVTEARIQFIRNNRHNRTSEDVGYWSMNVHELIREEE